MCKHGATWCYGVDEGAANAASGEYYSVCGLCFRDALRELASSRARCVRLQRACLTLAKTVRKLRRACLFADGALMKYARRLGWYEKQLACFVNRVRMFS
jgi:hypothetical protein